MTFEDLPEDWGSKPITPELMPDVVDLFVNGTDRRDGCLMLLPLDEDLCIANDPMAIGGFDPEPDPDKAEQFLQSMCALACEANCSYVIARGRSGPAVPTPDDDAWFGPVHRGLGNHLLASFVASSRGVVKYEAEALA